MEGLGAPILRRYSMTMLQENQEFVKLGVNRIRKENNRMLERRGSFYMLKLAQEQASSTGKELTSLEMICVLRNPKYLFEDDIEDYYVDD